MESDSHINFSDEMARYFDLPSKNSTSSACFEPSPFNVLNLQQSETTQSQLSNIHQPMTPPHIPSYTDSPTKYSELFACFESSLFNMENLGQSESTQSQNMLNLGQSESMQSQLPNTLHCMTPPHNPSLLDSPPEHSAMFACFESSLLNMQNLGQSESTQSQTMLNLGHSESMQSQNMLNLGQSESRQSQLPNILHCMTPPHNPSLFDSPPKHSVMFACFESSLLNMQNLGQSESTQSQTMLNLGQSESTQSQTMLNLRQSQSMQSQLSNINHCMTPLHISTNSNMYGSVDSFSTVSTNQYNLNNSINQHHDTSVVPQVPSSSIFSRTLYSPISDDFCMDSPSNHTHDDKNHFQSMFQENSLNNVSNNGSDNVKDYNNPTPNESQQMIEPTLYYSQDGANFYEISMSHQSNNHQQPLSPMSQKSMFINGSNKDADNVTNYNYITANKIQEKTVSTLFSHNATELNLPLPSDQSSHHQNHTPSMSQESIFNNDSIKGSGNIQNFNFPTAHKSGENIESILFAYNATDLNMPSDQTIQNQHHSLSMSQESILNNDSNKSSNIIYNAIKPNMPSNQLDHKQHDPPSRPRKIPSNKDINNSSNIVKHYYFPNTKLSVKRLRRFKSFIRWCEIQRRLMFLEELVMTRTEVLKYLFFKWKTLNNYEKRYFIGEAMRARNNLEHNTDKFPPKSNIKLNLQKSEDILEIFSLVIKFESDYASNTSFNTFFGID